MWARIALLGLLIGLVPIEGVPAEAPVVSYPAAYRTSLVKYAVVDRVDGLSRDLYASKDAIEALKRDPRLREFPVGVLLAVDVYRAKALGRDPRTGAAIFATDPQKHLVRGRGERTLHLMQKTQPGFGSQNWTFGGFDPVTAEPLKLELPGDCLLCHQAAVVSDMAFSLNLMRRFTTTGAVQYSFCPQPGRQICPF
jgi:hypothetical protein